VGDVIQNAKCPLPKVNSKPKPINQIKINNGIKNKPEKKPIKKTLFIKNTLILFIILLSIWIHRV
jgi:hypothetical protein